LAGRSPDESVIEIIGKNERSILMHPDIIFGLAQNPRAPKYLLERLQDLYRKEKSRRYSEDLSEEQKAALPHLEKAAPPPEEPPPEVTPEEEAKEEPILEFPDDRLHPGFRITDLLNEEFDTPELFAMDLMREPEKDGGKEVPRSLQQRLLKMAMVDRLLLALHGNIEARRFLIRSTNKMVQDCVLRNPKFTIREAIELDKDRDSPQNVIETICLNREWTRNYQVALRLSRHPKTPLRFAIRFLNRLTVKDIARISKSKQVPQAAAQQARAILRHRDT